MPPIPKQEIGNELGQQDLPHPHARDHQRLHGAAFPFPRDHQSSQQRSGQRHDHRDQAGNQIVPAAHRRIEAHLRLDRERRRRRTAGRPGARREPCGPDLLDITLDDARGVGVDAVDDDADRRGADRVRAAAEIAPQPDDAVHLARRHGLLGGLDVEELARAEIRRTGELAGEAGGERVGPLHDQRQRHVAGVERDPVSEDQQQHRRQDEGDRERRGVAPDLQELLAHQPEQAAKRGCHAAAGASAASITEMNASSMVGSGRSTRRAALLIASGAPSVRTSPFAMITSRSQYSASSMKCVVTSTVTPASASALMRRQNSRRASGSTPEVGSSRNRYLGLVHQRAGEREPLLEAEREIARCGVEHRAETEFGCGPVDASPLARA